MRAQDEDKVNRMVQQWLHERGYTRALKALQEESFVEAPEDVAIGGQLAAIMYEHWEMKQVCTHAQPGDVMVCLRCDLLVAWQALETGAPDPLDVDRREAEEEILALPEEVPYPCEHVRTIANVHTGNVICCRYNSDGSLIATGSSDRSIRIIDVVTCKPLRQLALHTAPVLCVLFCPTRSSLLLSTAMDGSVVLSNAETGCIYHESKNHSKYAHRAVWSPCGTLFATLGHDKTVCVYKISGLDSGAWLAADPACDGAGGGEGGEAPGVAVVGLTVEVEVFRKKALVNIPEAACFLDDAATLVLAKSWTAPGWPSSCVSIARV